MYKLFILFSWLIPSLALTGYFQLKELGTNYVIYHSGNSKTTLVLFRTNKECGTSAYYFENVGPERINGKNVYKIMNDFQEEDKNSIFPERSTILSTNEYEGFMHK
jgi:hypothetical protein